MNEPEPRTHGLVSYRHPADIDGDPEQVARASLAALADIAAVAHEVAKATYLQARNAHLESLSELSGEAVVAWENGHDARALKAVEKSTEGTRRVATVLARRAVEDLSSGTVLET